MVAAQTLTDIDIRRLFPTEAPDRLPTIPLTAVTKLMYYELTRIPAMTEYQVLELTQLHESWRDDAAMNDVEFATVYFELEAALTRRKVELGILTAES